jgi:hypothetical protein
MGSDPISRFSGNWIRPQYPDSCSFKQFRSLEHRQPDNTRVTTGDFLNKYATLALDCVGTSLIGWLPTLPVSARLVRTDFPKPDIRDRQRRPHALAGPNGNACQHLVGCSGQPCQHLERICLIHGLAENIVAEYYSSIGSDNDEIVSRRARSRLIPSQAQHHIPGRFAVESLFVDISPTHTEIEAKRLKYFAAPRR